MSLVGFRRVGLVAVLALATASVASAQSLRPTPAAWAEAERVVRAHYANTRRALVDVAPQHDRALGTTFWVRFADGDGSGLVAVRGTDVIDTRGDASVASILRADDTVHTRAWSAADLLYLCATLGTPPPLARAPITGGAVPVLEPTLGYGRDVAALVVYAYRDGPAEHAVPRAHYVQRAVGTIDATGTIAWTVTNVILDLRGHERLLPGTPRQTQYDACRQCLALGVSCDACRSRSCRTCLEHSIVLTDPSFCIPRCR